MALVGMQLERARIQASIEKISKMLGQPAAHDTHPAKRALSPAARRRIGAAQKKRWAEFHAQRKGGAASD